jgi:type III pantothenate kinase
MILAIDAGNTLLKWGVHRNGFWLQQGAVTHTEVVRLGEVWKPYGPPSVIVISNVAGEKIRSALTVLFSRFRIAPLWVHAQAEGCGVRNRYENPAQLGSDRWAALVAARRLHAGACVVCTAGTAMTIDALTAEGEFLGGLILPGLRLMLESLSTRTAGIRLEQGAFAGFPVNTRDAVHSGAIQACVGAVERLRARMGEEGHSPAMCLLSGGAAPLLEARIPTPLRRVDNLVLEGLISIAQHS